MVTSYYGSIYLSNAQYKLTPVSVSIGVPNLNPNIFSIKELNPSISLLKDYHKYEVFDKNHMTENEYIKRYYEETLKNLSPSKIYEKILYLVSATGLEAALCCFCKPKSFCHRHLIAAWINQILKEDLIVEIGESNPRYVYTEKWIFRKYSETNNTLELEELP